MLLFFDDHGSLIAELTVYYKTNEPEKSNTLIKVTFE